MNLSAEKDGEADVGAAKSPTRSLQSDELYEPFTEADKHTEKRIVRKLDLTVVPVLWCLFLVSFVDRGNIGNAKIAGMTKTLKLQGDDYNKAVWVFTLAYVVFSIPATIVFKKTGPKSLPVMIFCWGRNALYPLEDRQLNERRRSHCGWARPDQELWWTLGLQISRGRM